jgi:hypothetical protein
MKSFVAICFAATLAFISLRAGAQNTDPDTVARRRWILPDQVSVQFAGNIGLISGGVGYSLLKNRSQLTLMYGYVPASVARKEIHLISMKGNVTLFNLTIRSHAILPYFGLAGTMETGRNTFIRLPSKYPKGYYHSNAFHLSGALGIRTVIWSTDSRIWVKGVEMFSELGSQDIFVYYKITQHEVDVRRILNVCIGLNLLLP